MRERRSRLEVIDDEIMHCNRVMSDLNKKLKEVQNNKDRLIMEKEEIENKRVLQFLRLKGVTFDELKEIFSEKEAI